MTKAQFTNTARVGKVTPRYPVRLDVAGPYVQRPTAAERWDRRIGWLCAVVLSAIVVDALTGGRLWGLVS